MRRIRQLLERTGRRSRPRRGHEAGITLIEIMIVLALMGLVTAAIVGGVMPAFSKGKIKTAKAALVPIIGAVAQYTTDNDGKCPSMDELVASGFLQKSQLKDPWGNPYTIKDCTGPEGAHIVSLGPDKQEGTADDIKSAE